LAQEERNTLKKTHDMSFRLDPTNCTPRCRINKRYPNALWINDEGESLKEHLEYCGKCLRLLQSYEKKSKYNSPNKERSLKITPSIRQSLNDRKLYFLGTGEIQKSLQLLKFAKWMQQLERKGDPLVADLIRTIKAFVRAETDASRERVQLDIDTGHIKELWDLYRVSSPTARKRERQKLEEQMTKAEKLKDEWQTSKTLAQNISKDFIFKRSGKSAKRKIWSVTCSALCLDSSRSEIVSKSCHKRGGLGELPQYLRLQSAHKSL
jgi:hypothetical protein